MAKTREDVREDFVVLLREIIATQEQFLTYFWPDEQLRASSESLLHSAKESLAAMEQIE